MKLYIHMGHLPMAVTPKTTWNICEVGTVYMKICKDYEKINNNLYIHNIAPSTATWLEPKHEPGLPTRSQASICRHPQAGPRASPVLWSSRMVWDCQGYFRLGKSWLWWKTTSWHYLGKSYPYIWSTLNIAKFRFDYGDAFPWFPQLVLWIVGFLDFGNTKVRSLQVFKCRGALVARICSPAAPWSNLQFWYCGPQIIPLDA